ncbi:hypothetical protein GALMADRAFT_147614 [Galerina marginata CBS 339.88]|uniref:Uncharacterized protein n=1 Tax=Galerina marginata (strain CBS 339.88) TaxID=685588 RepID=A0A067S7D6_GALM3|nr:hypothetical protein GALMADRAFT_147614 [Galerina marginata CBS 339.88]
MAPLITPTPGVRYRFQNVDFRTYLERRSSTDLVMRRWKDSLQQQWSFKKISDGVFEIINGENKDYRLEASAVGSEFKPIAQTITPGIPQRLQWKLVDAGRGSFYNYNSNNIFLHLENDKDSLVRPPPISVPTSTTISKEANYRWNIIEDSPAMLPDGTGKYVIQTLKGDGLQPASAAGNTTKLSIGDSYLGDEHIWEIVDLGNGKGTIKNVQVDAFLDVQQVGSAGEWKPILSKATPAPQWDIRKTAGFAFSLTVERQVNATARTRLALTVLKDDIVLKPNKDVQNQMWSIVPIDLASFKAMIIRNPTVNLPEGEYALHSDNGFYLKARADGIYVNTSELDYFKFEPAGGTYAPGLGYVYISHRSGPPEGFVYVAEYSASVVYHRPKVGGIESPKEVWRVELVSSMPPKYTISHIVTGKTLEALDNSNNQSSVEMGKHPTATGTNKWSFIPKP